MSGSVAVGLAQAIVGMIILANPDVQSPPTSSTLGRCGVDVDGRLCCNRG